MASFKTLINWSLLFVIKVFRVFFLRKKNALIFLEKPRCYKNGCNYTD